jgi:tetratricopeptide (TPR) repeat protein
MKLLNSLKSIFSCVLIISAASLIQACSMAESKQNTSATDNSLAVPALKERKGELAKTAEWEKTKLKVAELTQAIAANPSDAKPRLQLATIYIAEARITGEHPYYYPAILTILDGVLSLEPKSFEALVLKSSVKMSQHQFAEAKTIADKAKQINPNNAYLYGVLADANVELGNYQEAIAMSDKMQTLKPSLESYSRASYLREIHGDYPGAIEAMTLAVQAGLPGSEPHSWSQNTLGYLYEKTGQWDKAEGEYRAILERRPSYAFAIKGLADVYAAKKDYAAALNELTRAAAMMPEFSFYEKMGDIYALQGERAKATETYKEVLDMLKDDEQSGHTVNLELARIHTKIGDYRSANECAMKEYKVRSKNIDVNHMLALISYKSGDLANAKRYISTALATGSKDPELLWIAGTIEKSAGNDKQAAQLMAQAKKVNSHFEPSIYLN